MCRKIESVTIFRIVKAIDRNAFVTQGNVNGVYGMGFDEVKVKVQSDDKKNRSVEANYKNPTLDKGSDQTSHSSHPRSMA
jgi:hypothetical protein